MGSVQVTSILAELPTGTSNIGSVSIEKTGHLTLGSVYTLSDAPETIATWLETLSGSGVEQVNISYFGTSGSLIAIALT